MSRIFAQVIWGSSEVRPGPSGILGSSDCGLNAESRQVEASRGRPRQIGGNQQSSLGMGHLGPLWDTRGKTHAGNHKTVWEVYKTMKPH